MHKTFAVASIKRIDHMSYVHFCDLKGADITEAAVVA